MKKTIFIALMGFAPVFAATTTCTSELDGKLISGALDVPAGATCKLVGSEVTGTVTVEGVLSSYGTRFDANVNVTGGVITISNGNGYGSELVGNLSITGSSGNSGIYCPNTNFFNVIGGNISFQNNSGNFYVCQAIVLGGVTVSNNTRVNNDYSGAYVGALNNIKATKNLSCDGNVSSNGSPAVVGGANNAAQMTGQCSTLNQ
jgi:hypothetical protein